MKSIFITGTDTEVGKTVVSAALLSILRGRGINAIPMKPIQTGCKRRKDKWLAPDLEFLLKAANLEISQEEKSLMCPYTFELPCSPHLAAEHVEERISLEYIIRCFRELEEKGDMVIVEGAGGILVPINGNKMMLDLMVMLKLPVILVARPGLGTINHTLLSIHELNRAGLIVLGVVFCETAPAAGNYIEEDNRLTIARLGQVPILGTLPFITDIAGKIESTGEFYKLCTNNLSAALNIIEEL